MGFSFVRGKSCTTRLGCYLVEELIVFPLPGRARAVLLGQRSLDASLLRGRPCKQTLHVFSEKADGASPSG